MGRGDDLAVAVMTHADLFWEGSRASTEMRCPGPREEPQGEPEGGAVATPPPPPDSARVGDSQAPAMARGEPSKAAHRKAITQTVPVATTPGRPVAGATG